MAKTFNLHTNRQGLIVVGGESSSDYGMVITEAPTFERPKRKQTVYSVPGRNGSIIFQQDAWDDVTRRYKVALSTQKGEDLPELIDSFCGWLNAQKGYVRLEDNFEPDVFRLAYYSGGNDFTNELLQCGESTLTFTCRPERFYKEGDIEREVVLSPGGSIFNPTKFGSKPIIHIENSSDSWITINNIPTSTSFLFKITNSGYINIDTETMQAYQTPNVSMNQYLTISDEKWPVLLPGRNSIVVTSGTVTKMTMIPRFFTI